MKKSEKYTREKEKVYVQNMGWKFIQAEQVMFQQDMEYTKNVPKITALNK